MLTGPLQFRLAVAKNGWAKGKAGGSVEPISKGQDGPGMHGAISQGQ